MPDTPDNIEEIREQLTAYLDGELSVEDVQRVEDRLLADEQFRFELQRLQKTWDLLDQLPTSQPNQSFTQSTLELVVTDATEEVRKNRRQSWNWPFRLGVLLGLPLAAGLCTFLAANYVQDAPNRELLSNLHLVENINVYDTGESIEFLSGLLDDEHLTELGDTGEEELPDEFRERLQRSSPVETKARLKSLDPRRLGEIRQLKIQFDSMSKQERQSLTDFAEQLNGHVRSAELKLTMYKYFDWLKTVPEGERAKLLDLPPDQRIVRIRELKHEQAVKAFGMSDGAKLPVDDLGYVYQWTQKVLENRATEIRPRIAKLIDQGKLKEVAGRGGRLLQKVFEIDPTLTNLLFTDEVIEDLKLGLSPKAVEILESQPEKERRKLMIRWFVAAEQARNEFTDEEMQRFMEEKLTQKQRDYIENLSPDIFRSKLQEIMRYYY